MKIHYGGALTYSARGQMVRVGAGYAACARGEAAQRIADLGSHTLDPDEVTCSKCRRILESADEISA